MKDPRELCNTDPFDNITSDSDEEQSIQKRLDEIEAQRKDLEDRLKKKQEKTRISDPNFNGVQISSSPEKKAVNKKNKQHSTREYDLLKTKDVEIESHDNEKRLSERLERESLYNDKDNSISSIPSFFAQKFQKSKQDEKIKIQQYQEMMSSRVHTFNNSSEGKTYKPILNEELEEYSHLWVKKRYIPKNELNKIIRDIKVLRLSKLFAKVRPPKFVEPQYSNWAVIGIVSKKDDIKFTASDKPQKYFKFTISNFKYNLDTYIFGNDGVEKYYNIRIGDIIAILNPEILPWRPSGKEQFIKSFNLRISHGYNCILELAQSRDLGWCPEIIKGQNKPCRTPINISTDRCCEYHREIQFRKTNAKRVDLTGGYALGAPTKSESQPALYKTADSNSRNIKPNTKQYRVLPSWSQQNPQFYDKYGGKSRYFSNSKAAKAFFDERYQNPDMISNLESKRRKIMGEKKDSAMDKQLDRILHKNQESVEGLSNKKTAYKIKENTQNVLQSGIIQRLGFDPTHGKMATVLNHINKGTGSDMPSENDGPHSSSLKKKDNVIRDLLNFKKEKVVLKPSKIALMNKMNRRESVWKKTFGAEAENTTTEDNNDSDLEISYDITYSEK